MNPIVEAIVSIAAGITGVAILAVIVSRNSNTVGVIRAATDGYSNALAVAISPVANSRLY